MGKLIPPNCPDCGKVTVLLPHDAEEDRAKMRWTYWCDECCVVFKFAPRYNTWKVYDLTEDGELVLRPKCLVCGGSCGNIRHDKRVQSWMCSECGIIVSHATDTWFTFEVRINRNGEYVMLIGDSDRIDSEHKGEIKACGSD